MIGLLTFAFVAGTVATANPCGFALLPAFIAQQLRTSAETTRSGALARAFAVGGTTTVGFLIVFGTIGTALALGARWLAQLIPWAALVIGVALIGAGIAVLLGRHVGIAAAGRVRPAGKTGYRSTLLFGLGYGLASLSCTLPIFLVVIAATVTASMAAAALAFAAYALGMGTILTALAVAAALSHAGVAARLRRFLPYLNPLSGILLVAAGVYVVYYFAFALLPASTTTSAQARPIDAVSRLATQIQGWLDGTTGRTVSTSLAAALALLGMSLVWRWARSWQAARLLALPTDGRGQLTLRNGASASSGAQRAAYRKEAGSVGHAHGGFDSNRGVGDPSIDNANERSTSQHDCCNSATPAERTTKGVASRSSSGNGPLVEILYFDGCPNHEPALALVERVSRDLAIEPEIRLVDVPDQESAQRVRFLGSPTIRVGGRDVEPGADERTDYGLSCRVFRTASGFSGEPDERWVRDALLREGTVAA